jgi:hypothetical protein
MDIVLLEWRHRVHLTPCMELRGTFNDQRQLLGGLSQKQAGTEPSSFYFLP